MRDDAANLDENVRDATAVVLTDGLALLDQFHDPHRALELINDGTLTNPSSPQAYRLRQTIEAFLAGRPPGEIAGLDVGNIVIPEDRLYGWRQHDLELAARRLGEHIGPGEPHESLFLGGDYYLWRLDGAELQLLHNRELDEELAEPHYSEYPLLVRVLGNAAPPRWDAIATAVGLVPLRARGFTSEAPE